MFVLNAYGLQTAVDYSPEIEHENLFNPAKMSPHYQTCPFTKFRWSTNIK